VYVLAFGFWFQSEPWLKVGPVAVHCSYSFSDFILITDCRDSHLTPLLLMNGANRTYSGRATLLLDHTSEILILAASDKLRMSVRRVTGLAIEDPKARNVGGLEVHTTQN